jgi:7,8-dihydropterin-6-yl-methyl-4-(beta-D-ribofuranosyl)aminobenzene 5'-phosphate synthase
MTPGMPQTRPREQECSVTVVYDNYQVRSDLSARWGFGCVIRMPAKTILFDTGGDGSILLSNMERIGIGPQEIDIVVISHIHADHLGGLQGFLERRSNIPVFVPGSFPDSIKKEIRSFGAECHGVKETMEIAPGVYSTGEMGAWIKEQSLILDTRKGTVVITGCAHPGIVNIVKKAKAMRAGRRIHLVMGGFHLGSADSELRAVIKAFRNLGVERTGPCHCSGDRCRQLFEEEYGENYIDMGVGRFVAF